MICVKCAHQQTGGSICPKCGRNLRSSGNRVLDSNGLFQRAGNQPDQPADRNRNSEKHVVVSKPNKYDNSEPIPEVVRRKVIERSKFKLKGISLILFWIKNLLFRSLEGVIFCGVFHGGIWLLIYTANFFGGFVSPDTQIHFDLMVINTWEYIAFAIIIISTFRKRWGT